MNVINTTAEFADWLDNLKDRAGRIRIARRIDATAIGNLGDCEPVGEGVSEMRIHCGPGYRVYFTRTGNSVFCCWQVAIKAANSVILRVQLPLRAG